MEFYQSLITDNYMKVFNRAVAILGGIFNTIGTAIAVAGAATLNTFSGKVTSEALTTAQNAIYTLTVTNEKVKTGSMVLVSVSNGTNTQGTPIIGRVATLNGSFTVQVINQHASAQALNGTVVVNYLLINPL